MQQNKLKESVFLVNSKQILDLVEKRISLTELREETLSRVLRICRPDEIAEATLWVEDFFQTYGNYLDNISIEEFEVLSRFGGKIGTNSYDINYLLRNKKPLGELARNVEIIDRLMEKLTFQEDTVVYRALKTFDGIDMEQEELANVFTDLGYMSCSLGLESSYAYFKEYSIVLRIIVPEGTSYMYLEWFKGSDDEKEVLLPKGMTLIVHSYEEEMVEGQLKKIYDCSIKQKEKDNEATK